MTLALLRERLIFGTGRLSGGGYAGQSRQMIAACQGAGIVRFDTAPIYGLGGAEQLLGMTAGQGAIIHTKIGSRPPAFPALRGWAKWFRNMAPNSNAAGRLYHPPQRFARPSAQMDFSPDAVAQSLARSRRLLRRDRLDLVMLHEAEPWQVPEATRALLEVERDAGRIGALGFAHSGPPLQETAGWIAQCAPWADSLAGSGAGRIFHSILRAAVSCDDPIAAEIDQTVAELSLRGQGPGGRYLAALVWLHRRQPEAGLVFATTAPERLASFLALLDRIAPRK